MTVPMNPRDIKRAVRDLWTLVKFMPGELERRFVAWADDVSRRSRAGLFGSWPWQAKPDTRHVFFDACCTDEAARQIARTALAQSGAEFAVVHYQDVDGTRKTLVEAR